MNFHLNRRLMGIPVTWTSHILNVAHNMNSHVAEITQNYIARPDRQYSSWVISLTGVKSFSKGCPRIIHPNKITLWSASGHKFHKQCFVEALCRWWKHVPSACRHLVKSTFPLRISKFIWKDLEVRLSGWSSTLCDIQQISLRSFLDDFK